MSEPLQPNAAPLAGETVLPVAGTSSPLAHPGDCTVPALPAAPADLPAAEVDSSGASVIEEGKLLDALRLVIDPELMINIVDLGLVYGVVLDQTTVKVEMTLTSPACPAGPQIVSQSRQALERVPGVKAAEIKLVLSPPWTPDRMTDEARDQLGIF